MEQRSYGRPMPKDSMTQLNAQRVQVFFDDGNKHDMARGITPEYQRHLVFTMPITCFTPNAKCLNDIRVDHEHYRRGLSFFLKLYSTLVEQAIADHEMLPEFNHQPAANLYLELAAETESGSYDELERRLNAIIKDKRIQSGPEVAATLSSVTARELAKSTLKRQKARNCQPHAWRLHLFIRDRHPIRLFEMQRRAEVLAARQTAAWGAARGYPVRVIKGEEGIDDDEKDALDKLNGNRAIGESVLTSAFKRIVNDIQVRIAEAKEKERGNARFLPSSIKPRGVPDKKEDPFAFFRSGRDIFLQLQKCVPTFEFEPVPDEAALSYVCDEPLNSLSLLRFFNVDLAIGVNALHVADIQKSTSKYRNFQFPMPARTWAVYDHQASNLLNVWWPTVPDPKRFGKSHEQLETTMLQSSEAVQLNFLLNWNSKMKRKTRSDDDPLVLPPLVKEAMKSLGAFEKTGKGDEKQIFIQDILEYINHDDENRSKRQKQMAETVVRAVRDTIRDTALFEPEPEEDRTWRALEEANARDLAELEEACSNWDHAGISASEIKELREIQMTQYKITSFNACMKLMADASTNKKLSDADKTLCKFGADFLMEHGSFYRFSHQKMYMDQSSFAQMIMWMSTAWKQMFQCNRNIAVCMQIFISLLHQHRPCKLNPHILLMGEQSAGKSFLLDIAHEMFIPGTLVNISSMSEKAQHVEGDISGKGFLMEELDPAIMGSNGIAAKKGSKEAQATTTTEALWKNKLTRNEIYAEVFDVDKETGKRVTLKIQVLANCTYVFCTNYEGTQSHSGAMRSRFSVIDLPPQCEVDNPVSQLARRGENYLQDHNARLSTWRMMQYLVFVVSKLMAVRCFKAPDMTAAENFIRQILQRASALGASDTSEVRKLDRVIMNLETVVIMKAVYEEFIINPTACRTGTWTSDFIRRCEPRMVASMEELMFTLHMHTDQFTNKVRKNITESIWRQYFRDPEKCIIYREMKNQIVDETKPYWKQFIATKKKTDEAKAAAGVRTDDVANADMDADDDVSDLELPVPLMLAAFGEIGKVDDAVDRLRKKRAELKRAGWIVLQKKGCQLPTPNANGSAAVGVVAAAAAAPVVGAVGGSASGANGAGVGVVSPPAASVVSSDDFVYFVADPDRLACRIGESEIKMLKNRVKDELRSRFSDQLIDDELKALEGVFTRRTVSHEHFDVFEESRHSVAALYADSNNSKKRNTFECTEDSFLYISMSFVLNRTQNPIHYASISFLHHLHAPERPFLCGYVIHPNSGMWTSINIPKHPSRVIRHRHVNEVTDADRYILMCSTNPDAFCDEGPACKKPECDCRRPQYEFDRVLLDTKIIEYKEDPDEISFRNRQIDTGWTKESLNDAGIYATLTPAKAVEYWKINPPRLFVDKNTKRPTVMRSYADDLKMEAKRMKEKYANRSADSEARNQNGLRLSGNRTVSVVAAAAAVDNSNENDNAPSAAPVRKPRKGTSGSGKPKPPKSVNPRQQPPPPPPPQLRGRALTMASIHDHTDTKHAASGHTTPRGKENREPTPQEVDEERDFALMNDDYLTQSNPRRAPTFMRAS